MGVNLKKIQHILFFVIFIPAISIGSAWLLNWLLQQARIPVSFLPFLDTIGPIGFYGIYYQLFNRSLWRNVPAWTDIVSVPNLSGRWEGELFSSYNGKRKPYKTSVEIEQTFSDIRILCYFCKSRSYSIVSGFYDHSDGNKLLQYIFHNEVYEMAESTMHDHYGMAKHVYKKSTNEMECFYFNEPDHQRGNNGQYTVKFKQKELLHHL